jgi:hypothetical protein
MVEQAVMQPILVDRGQLVLERLVEEFDDLFRVALHGWSTCRNICRSCLFLGVALVLSSAFVFLPMIVSRAFTGSHKPTRKSSPNMSAAFPPSRIRAASSTCASISSRSCSSSSISKRRSSIPGR